MRINAEQFLPRRAWLAALLVVVIGVLAGAACAATYYVSTSGSDETGTGASDSPWATIGKADASNALLPGDTVIVAAGTYPQSSLNGVVIANCSGSAGSPITYKAEGAVLIDQSAYPGESYGIKVAGNMHDLVFEGFEIANCQWGMYFDSYINNMVITKCHIHNMLPADAYGAAPASWAGGVWMSHPDNCTISYNLIHDVTASDWAACLFLPCMTNNKIYNNTLASSGIGIQDWIDGYAGNQVTNNIFANLYTYGMATGTKNGIVSSRNLFTPSYTNYSGQAKPGLGDITADPLFNADYTLMDGSPAINAGIDIGQPFIGSAPDMGAFESASTVALGTVTGKVHLGATEYRPARPIAGIIVESLSYGIATTTNENGEYVLPLLPGDQSLSAHDLTGALGYQEAVVTVTALTATVKDFYFEPQAGNTYYVATTGSDETGDGSEGNPWATIGYADKNGILQPGDKVIVGAGTYTQTAAGRTTPVVSITVSGTLAAPIVYKAAGQVVIDNTAGVGADQGIYVEVGTHDVIFDGFEIKGGQWGFYFNHFIHDCMVIRCKISGQRPLDPNYGNWPSSWCGAIWMSNPNYCDIYNNVFSDIGTPGNWHVCLFLPAMKYNRIFNNTFIDSEQGICDWLTAEAFIDNQVRNNIFKGIRSVVLAANMPGEIVNSNNLFYECGTRYSGTVAEGPGEFGANPMFVAGSYELQSTSPAINKGTDVGLPFFGAAPDIGAFESPYDPQPGEGTITGRVISLGSQYAPAGPAVGHPVNETAYGYSTTTDSQGAFSLTMGVGQHTLSVLGAPNRVVTVVRDQTTTIPDIIIDPTTGNKYYVATTGSDVTGNGTAAAPWATIDHADAAGIIKPGDTILVAAGTYPQTTLKGVNITKFGVPAMPIVYKATGSVVIDQTSNTPGASSGIYVGMNSQDLVFDGFEFLNGQWGIYFDSYIHRMTVANCKFHGMRAADLTAPLPAAWCAGIWCSVPHECSFHNNLFYDIGVAGAWNTCMLLPAMEDNKIYNNTFVDSEQGICDWLSGGFTGNLITNNIFKGMRSFSVQNGEPNGVVASYNLHFGTPVNGNYIGTVVVGDGEITGQDPLLAPDYTLLDGSPAIDAGINVGLPFSGLAPDLGAFERVTAIDIAKLSDIAGLDDGTEVNITDPKIATVASGAFTDGSIYVQEPNRLLGIKVIPGATTVAVGDSFTLAGTLGTDANGERTITLGSIGAITAGAQPKTLGLRSTSIISGAPRLTGTLVRVWGEVKYKDANYMYVDDGTGAADGNTAGMVGIRVILSGLSAPITQAIAQGNTVTVTGVLGLAKDGTITVSALRPRADADIVVYP